MPRRVRPWYRKSRMGWFISHNGRQIPLGISDPNAVDAAKEAAQKLVGATSSAPLGEAVAAFLARIDSRVKPDTKRVYQWFLGIFSEYFGHNNPLQSLTAHAVERSAQKPTWSQSTRHDYLGAIGTFLREMGHPLKLRRPPQTSRGVEAVWTEQEFWRIHGAARSDLKPLLIVLRDTGARPGEIAALTVEIIDWNQSCAILKAHKNAAKGKPRVLHFAGAALAALEEQRRQYETGLLFRTERDTAFRPCSLTVRIQRARERAGIERPLSAYGLRHGYITRALAAGFSSEQVAALVGNSAAMVDRVYNHLVGANAELLKGIAEKMATKAG